MKATPYQRLLSLAHFGFDIADLPDREPQTSIGVPAVRETHRQLTSDAPLFDANWPHVYDLPRRCSVVPVLP